MTAFHAFAEAHLIPAQLVLAMLGMGATLSPRDFADVARRPVGLAIGLAIQLVLVPLWALAFTRVFGLSAGWAVGLIVVAAVPGGAFSNLLTFLARGNTPLSISLTVACTAACAVTTPLLLDALASAHLPADFALPVRAIAFEIGGYLIIPLLAGMLAYRLRPAAASAIARWSIRGSVLLLCVITISALGSGRIDVPAYGWRPPLLIIAFAVSLSWLAPIACRMLGRGDADGVAIGIEVVVRNIGVALLLVHFFFPGADAQGHVLYTCLFYAGTSGPVALPMVLRHRWGRSPIPLLPRRPG